MHLGGLALAHPLIIALMHTQTLPFVEGVESAGLLREQSNTCEMAVETQQCQVQDLTEEGNNSTYINILLIKDK